MIFSQARGSTLIDEEGTEYIDFFSGAGTLNYGHNNPVLKEKLLDYVRADGVVHGLDMATSAKKAFLKTVDRVLLKPRNWQYTLQFTGPTGTNAVEAALKIARQVKGPPQCGVVHARLSRRERRFAGGDREHEVPRRGGLRAGQHQLHAV